MESFFSSVDKQKSIFVELIKRICLISLANKWSCYMFLFYTILIGVWFSRSELIESEHFESIFNVTILVLTDFKNAHCFESYHADSIIKI